MAHPAYVLVTPARNEEPTIEHTLRSVLGQTVLPQEWVIVSDGSTDRTDAIVGAYARANSFIRLLRLDGRPGRNFASVVFATEAGCQAIRTKDYEFLGLLDADVRFEPDYFERLMARFGADARLGLAGGLVRDVVNGRVLRQVQNLREVAGAVHFFRRECFESLGGLVPIPEGGWDTITAVQARANGFTTRTFTDLVVDHLKPRNSGEGGAIKRKWQTGLRDYAVGNHLLWELIKCATRITESPLFLAAGARLAGFVWCRLSRRPRLLSPATLRRVRSEQLARLLPLRRAPGPRNLSYPSPVLRSETR